ncbi:hypothetical protein PR048_018207 [Dryococelus australis]|uniref:Uncharacterized protein n=1 Tax=Dryococelus australis TaxID=614101 RepID=A0ABQ9HC08_9NEOP|nr:hypothetical protein PR048_018207 [Dryococelus australis]
MQNAIPGFSSTGNFPFNNGIFIEAGFTPSRIIDRCLDENLTELPCVPVSAVSLGISLSGMRSIPPKIAKTLYTDRKSERVYIDSRNRINKTIRNSYQHSGSHLH